MICSYLRFIIHHFFLDFQLLFPYNKNTLIGISNCNILLTFLCYTTLSTQGRTHHEIETADCFCDFSMFTMKVYRRRRSKFRYAKCARHNFRGWWRIHCRAHEGLFCFFLLESRLDSFRALPYNQENTRFY